MSIACPGFIAAIDPRLCQAVDIYCERTSAAFWSEPINAVTNVAFLVAAWAAWQLQARHPDNPASGLTRALIVIVAIVGLGSFTFHTVGTAWAGWLDVIPILVFMLTYLWMVLTRVIGWPVRLAAPAMLVFFAATFSIEAFAPVGFLWGGAFYLPSIAVLLLFGWVFFQRVGPAGGRAFAIAVGVFILSYAARTADPAVCPAIPIGTHFIWHLLNAVFLYLLLRVTIVHGSKIRSIS